MHTAEKIISGGFGEPVLDAQRGFKALMDCMAHPGTIASPAIAIVPPTPLNRMAALAALTLFDTDTPYWLEGPMDCAVVRDWLGFHTGAKPAGEREQALFAILPAPTKSALLEGFALGSQEYPDRSATLILQVEGFAVNPEWRLGGPGIKSQIGFELLGMPRDFPSFWEGNRARFPCGIDFILAAPDALACLPRTTRIGFTDLNEEAA